MNENIRQVEVFSHRARGGRGYLLIDNRCSGGEYLELPTMTCCHCNSVVVLNSMRTKPRGFCTKCNAYCCDDKKCNEECYSFQRSLELALSDPTIPALPRTKDGGLLFDPALLEKGKVY